MKASKKMLFPDWSIVKEDSSEIITVMQNGGAEVDDLVKFYFPTLSDEERAEKIARINAQAQVKTDEAIERILNGGA